MDSTRPQKNTASDKRLHENFEPSMDWVREPAADTLMVYLPGFKKEQLKVQVTSSRYLRISGEGPGDDTNRTSQFRKEIPIASNYDPNEITAKFEKGILLIRHPKIIVPDNEPQKQNVIQPPPPMPPKPSVNAPKPTVMPPKPSIEKPLQPTEVEAVEPPRPTVKSLQPADVEAPKPEKPPAKPSKPAEVDRVNGRLEKDKNQSKHEANSADIKQDDVACCVQDNKGRGIANGNYELGMGNYKQILYDMVMKLKKNPNWVVAVLVVVIAIYAMKAIRCSSSKSEN